MRERKLHIKQEIAIYQITLVDRQHSLPPSVGNRNDRHKLKSKPL